ncbi:MAG: DUF3048 domain-containing protein [Ilumatobacteraceae bacterium]
MLPLLGMLAACSDSGDSTATSNADATVVLSTIPPSVAPPSTIPPSTIAVTTTTIPVAVFPLTGLPVGASAFAARPALVAKIDNATGAQPQTGFNAADIIYEEIVNDGITRFAMVFQSADSDPVGPCRSGRIQDIDLLGSLNAPLFVWSGGNDSVTRAVNNSDLVNLGPNYAPVYFRSDAHKAPHNLYTKTSEIYTYAPPGAQPPPQQFQYRDAAEVVGGAPSSGVEVAMDNYLVNWTWNAATGLYERMQQGKVQIDDATDSVITTNNVVVLAMKYTGAGSPNAQSVGTGEAFIFTGGNYIHGTWTRADRLQPFTLTDDSGNPIKLTPGRSFIELPRVDKTTPAP